MAIGCCTISNLWPQHSCAKMVYYVYEFCSGHDVDKAIDYRTPICN